MRTRESIRNTKTIFKRELAAYFESPVAYVFIIIFLLLLGFLTFNISGFFESNTADLRVFFDWHPWVYLFLIPSVAMRLWAEDRRLGTIELILTLPVTVMEAVLGKFLAAWFFIGICLALTLPILFTVAYLGGPDPGVAACGYLGSFLLSGSFLSVGIMTSSMTKSQVISFILSVVISLFLILAGFPPVLDALYGLAPLWLTNLVSQFSFLSHFYSMERGVIDLRDLVYFLSVMVFFLFVTGLIIQNRRTS
ncbi:MAG: ABC transporter permease subunit [Proteobacteria bacterium]|nr:ABC transporter permease subunit [Desulfobacteraceae bacterium]MBU4315739.1 ABC transporter permease subunit [Pseudomonadota bacterium]MBU4471597.1 ABC transporter permease subunit [Pseudomonadota bacterium]MCG2751079.1 ABC transporter permease subunit [Desulfobacteraceae bacterium]